MTIKATRKAHPLLFQTPRHTQECHATLVLLIYDALHLIIDLLLQGLQRKQQKRQQKSNPKIAKHFVRCLKWRNPHLFLSCMDTAYGLMQGKIHPPK